MIRIEIKDSCNGCGTCAKKCPTLVFAIEDKKCTTPQIGECMACRLCEVVCPVKAITVLEDL